MRWFALAFPFVLASPALAADKPPSGDLRAVRAAAIHVIYFAPAPLVPLETALPLCTPQADGTPVVSPAVQDDRAAASIAVARYPADRAPKLDDETLSSFGLDLSADDRTALPRSTDPVLIRTSAPVSEAARALRDTDRFLTCLAESMQGLVWDDTTRRLYGRAAFRMHRLDAWIDDRPPIAAEIAVNQFREGDSLRSVTRGMAKLALPDLVVPSHPAFLAEGIVALLVRTGAALVDEPRLRTAGRIALSDKVDVAVAYAKPGDSDPQNRLLVITTGDAAAQAALVGKLFGRKAEPQVTADTDDAELAAIQKRTQARLVEISPHFRPTPPASERLAVKAPFTSPDGRLEWMWVEVQRWEGDHISGPLQNDPFYLTTLHAGDKVLVAQEEIADYVLQRRGVAPEGGESMRVLEEREQKKR